MLAQIPNLPFDDVPDGADENGNVERHGFGARPQLCVQAEAAFRPRRSARSDGFRGGGEDVRRALRGAEEGLGAAGARARPVHARPPHTEHGYTEVNRRCWCTTRRCSARRSCRSSRTTCSSTTWRMLAAPDPSRLALIPTAEVLADQPRPRVHRRRGRTAAALYRAYAVLPFRSRLGGPRYARHDASASVHESRAGVDRDARDHPRRA